MTAEQATGFARLVRAFIVSVAGIKAAWRSEAAFRQECALAVLMLPAAFWLGTSAVERLLLVATVVLVLIVELLNSAVEAVVDRIGADHHALSGKAKDLGSAAVFLSLVLTGLVWGTLAWMRFR
jgi:diacylglycerol kinase (ATP)